MTLIKLKETLHAALKHTVRHIGGPLSRDTSGEAPAQTEGPKFRPRRDVSCFDVQRTAAEFKINWIYSDRQTYARPAAQASGTHLLLFHKNLSVTDISNAEVFQLVRLHSKLMHDDGRITQLTPDFLDDTQYTRCIENFLLPFAFDVKSVYRSNIDAYIEDVANEVAEVHSDFFLGTVAFDRMFNSLLLHIPRSIDIDLQSVVSELGYVHSAGHSVYARKAEKADSSEIEMNIEEFLASFPEQKYDLIPFSAFDLGGDFTSSSHLPQKMGLMGIGLNLISNTSVRIRYRIFLKS